MARNKILILTTKGCESCNFLRRNVTEAIHTLKRNDIEVAVKDKSDMSRRWIKTNEVTDFPTMFLIRDDLILNKYVGSYPTAVIIRWLDINFQ